MAAVDELFKVGSPDAYELQKRTAHLLSRDELLQLRRGSRGVAQTQRSANLLMRLE